MATVGRARQTAESLINSQLSRALYGEASEKDILLQYNAFCIGLLGAMLRNLAIFKVENRSHGSILFASPLGGDIEKIGHFQIEKTALEGANAFQLNIQ